MGPYTPLPKHLISITFSIQNLRGAHLFVLQELVGGARDQKQGVARTACDEICALVDVQLLPWLSGRWYPRIDRVAMIGDLFYLQIRECLSLKIEGPKTLVTKSNSKVSGSLYFETFQNTLGLCSF